MDVPRNARLPPAGNTLMLGVRPEEIQITNASGDGALPFDVEMVEELGAGRLLYGRLADTDCVVASPSTMASSTGQRVFVRILPEFGPSLQRRNRRPYRGGRLARTR